MEIVISCVAAGISLVALGLSWYQIRLSNKHQLFDRRLKIHSIFNEVMVNIELIKAEPKLNKVCTIKDAQNLMLCLLGSRSFIECFNLYISDREYINPQKYFVIMNINYDYMDEAELIFPSKVGKTVSNIFHNYIQLINQCVGYHNTYVQELKKHLDRDGIILDLDFSNKYRKREKQYISDINEEYNKLKNAYKVCDKENLDTKIRKLIKL